MKKNKKIKNKIVIFENKKIRRHWDDEKEEWYFSVVDVVEVLAQTDRPRKYWDDLKRKLKDEGSELSEKIGQLKMKSRILKKITCPVEILHKISFGIALVYLTIFLFGFFVPFNQTSAQTSNPSTISASLLTIAPGQPTTLKATMQRNVQGKTFINFFTRTGDSYNSIAYCFIPIGQKFCTAEFQSQNEGTFAINGHAVDSNDTVFNSLNSNLKIIVKTSAQEPPATTNPLTISADKTTVKLGETVKITAGILTRIGGEVITFRVDGVPENPATYQECTIKIPLTDPIPTFPVTRNCFVELRISEVGNHTIKATTSSRPGDPGYPLRPLLAQVQLEVKNNAVPITPGNTPPATETNYKLLAPFPGLTTIDTQKNDTTNQCPFGNYLNIMIKIIIGIAAVLAMVMIVMGGIEYMTSELVSSKESGKDTITHAVLGLLIALGAYLILNTINPQLLSACLDKLPKAEIVITSEDISDEGTTFDGKSTVNYKFDKIYLPNNSCPGQPGKESETCIKLKTTAVHKKNDLIEKSLEKNTLQKIVSFDNMVGNKGYYITEAFTSTYPHKSKCHNNGTCLDLNMVSTDQTPEHIKLLIDKLLQAGMCPNYEIIPGSPTRTQLNAIGIPNDRIWNGRGSGAHIHVVNAKCG